MIVADETNAGGPDPKDINPGMPSYKIDNDPASPTSSIDSTVGQAIKPAEVAGETHSKEHHKSVNRIILLSPLRKSEKKGLGKVNNRAADAMTRLATRDINAQKDIRTIDFRPEAEEISFQRQRLEDEIRTRIDRGEQVAVIGSSAGGQEALRLGKKLGVRAVSNQGRLAEGTSEHHPTLDHAAKHHPKFGTAVRDFEENIAPQVISDSHPESYLTIGAEHDSVVPGDLKSLPGIPHVKISNPKGILGLANKIPGIDHTVALYKGLRHPAVRKHIQVKK